MNVNQIYVKPVSRPIEGVIKADDKKGLQIEVEEYVLTNEIRKQLENFLNVYNSNTPSSNGVWISGFFGSGKSHLLKMVSYLLESHTSGTDDIVESFKKKCGDDTFFREALQRAVSIPSKSILFNIDQKADITNKKEADALLSVFLKVFNEMQGYFGKQAYIAEFERNLDVRNLYVKFKTEYERIANKPWELGREEHILESDDIAHAYKTVSGSSLEGAIDILDKYRDTYHPSIEDFAELVNAYIQRQTPGFRLNFFVDEVGQYIANNIKLMTNLQTIAESLATKCHGQAWIIVTAQEDIANVVGDVSKQQSNDFSKIQGRFQTRMKLTSQDVAEVIQKRLLSKNQVGERQLKQVYNAQVNNFKTLFDFEDGARSYRNFKNEEHFVASYPFIPYQFTLVQTAIQFLSEFNAFEGRHSSVGERSMLGVFQHAAVLIDKQEVGQLATFDLMFEGIRSSLKSSIQRSITIAEQNLNDEFATNLLKALLLVKYIEEFKATKHNLAILMTSSFGQDIGLLHKQVEEALNTLEQQTYIVRNGTEYSYLTDEEKDIEQKIKNTEVEFSELTEELSKFVFDRIIKENKIGLEKSAVDYPFTRKIDGQIKGKTHDLVVHLITPYHEHASNFPILQSQSMGLNELFIVLPPDDRVIRDLKLLLQTDKYLRLNIRANMDDTAKILTTKQAQNESRKQELEKQIRELLKSATFINDGNQLDLNSGEAQSKVIEGFRSLIRSTYTQFKMLPSTPYKDADVARYLHLKETDDLFNDTTLNESEGELFNFIKSKREQTTRVSLKALIEKFESKPYGWYPPAILCILAKLFARGQVEIRLDGRVLPVGKELTDALLNTRQHPNLILSQVEEFSPAQVRRLKDFFKNFVEQPNRANDAKGLVGETQDELKKLLDTLTTYTKEQRQYPFLSALTPVITALQPVINKSVAWYLTEFENEAENLMVLKETTIDPIQSFMSSNQKHIYDEARNFLNQQDANLASVGYGDAATMKQLLDSPTCFRDKQMPRVKTLTDQLQQQIQHKLAEAQQTASDALSALRSRLEQDERVQYLSNEQLIQMGDLFANAHRRLQQIGTIAVVEREVKRLEEEITTAFLNMAQAQTTSNSPLPVDEPRYVKSSSITVSFNKVSLDDEGDLEDYLKQLHQAYLNEIRNGRRIQL